MAKQSNNEQIRYDEEIYADEYDISADSEDQ